VKMAAGDSGLRREPFLWQPRRGGANMPIAAKRLFIQRFSKFVAVFFQRPLDWRPSANCGNYLSYAYLHNMSLPRACLFPICPVQRDEA
jgi:hypothetical protein